MNMYEKGTQVHATTVFFVKSGALYVDEAKEVAAKKEDAAKAIISGRVLVNDGTDFVVPTGTVDLITNTASGFTEPANSATAEYT